MPQTATLSERQNCRSVLFFSSLFTGLKKLNHATDYNIVREAKLSLSFVFLFTVQRIKVKISVMFQYSTRGKKLKYFRVSIFVFFMVKYNDNQNLTSIFNFYFK